MKDRTLGKMGNKVSTKKAKLKGDITSKGGVGKPGGPGGKR